MPAAFDVAVVGSGPSGSLAAAKLVAADVKVVMLDVGNEDRHYRTLVPDRSFSEVRRTDSDQRRYFLGDQFEGVPTGGVRVGAQLTPPRQYVTRDTERYLPTSGGNFEPMQSLALGGLGAAWGAASFTYSAYELGKAGIYEPDFQRHYDEVAHLIGVSGDTGDDASKYCFTGLKHCLPPLDIDSSAQTMWEAYRARRDDLHRQGFFLGRTPLAILSRDFNDREANPYHDMDFYSESRRSIFRPSYLIAELQKRSNFTLEKGTMVRTFEYDARGVTAYCKNLRTGGDVAVRARRLLLCAGALNSARIALYSLGLAGMPVPILCNPYLYYPCINLRTLGRQAADRRHSLSQLTGIYRPQEDPEDMISIQFYSYRSLLLFKLAKEIPLPPWAGLLLARLLVNSLVIVGLHHSDSPHSLKTMRVLPRVASELPELRFEYATTREERRLRDSRERRISRLLLRLDLLPCARISPGTASSIHYAGTIPIRHSEADGWGCRPDGRLWAAPNVYVGDSASWNFLPAKGPTFTIMANARRVTDHLLRDLGSGDDH